MMNLHFFMDPFGYYSSQFATKIDEIDRNNNLIVNINQAKITHQSIIYFSSYNNSFKKWFKAFKNIERVYFHFYNPIFQSVNKKIKNKFPSVTSVWVFWGGDFYSLPEFANAKYLAFSTKNTTKSYLSRTNVFRQIGVEIYYRAKYDIPYNHKRFIKSFEKIDYLATFFEQDYNNVNSYGQSNMKHCKFSYLSLNQILGDINSWSNLKLGDKIMIGHSADPSLNHYEILTQLNSLSCKKTILLPIHYGNNNYKLKLIEASKDFDLSIEYLEGYLPIEAYNKKLTEVGYAIFNVIHQQAFGNIIALLWIGVKVFLHNESAIYKEFKMRGFNIFSIDDIADLTVFEPLHFDQKEVNKKLLESILSKEKTIEMTHKLLDLKKTNLE